MDTSARGRAVESWVAADLEGRGYRLLARNFRAKSGEVDIVAEDGVTLCFIEVRSRTDEEHGTPLETIDSRKRSRIIAAARAFLLVHPELDDRPMRFDVVGVTLGAGSPAAVLVRGAFEVER